MKTRDRWDDEREAAWKRFYIVQLEIALAYQKKELAKIERQIEIYGERLIALCRTGR